MVGRTVVHMSDGGDAVRAKDGDLRTPAPLLPFRTLLEVRVPREPRVIVVEVLDLRLTDLDAMDNPVVDQVIDVRREHPRANDAELLELDLERERLHRLARIPTLEVRDWV